MGLVINTTAYYLGQYNLHLMDVWTGTQANGHLDNITQMAENILITWKQGCFCSRKSYSKHSVSEFSRCYFKALLNASLFECMWRGWWTMGLRRREREREIEHYDMNILNPCWPLRVTLCKFFTNAMTFKFDQFVFHELCFVDEALSQIWC